MKNDLLSEMRQAAREGDRAALQALLDSVKRDARQKERALKCLLVAIEHGHEALALDLLRWGVDADGASGAQYTPLVACAEFSRPALARELVAHGADIDKRWLSWTPLGRAALRGATETAQVLVEAGADVEAGELGPPLWWAAQVGHVAIVELLLEHGARPDTAKCSALHAAVAMGRAEIARILVQHGARLDRTGGGTGEAWNALDYARGQRQPNPEIIALLEAASAHSPTS